MKKSVNVFKKLGLFLFLVLAVVLISRCVKDPTYDSKYTITATSVGVGGTVSPSYIEVAKGESAAVSLKPDSGYDVDVVKVDGNIEPVPTNLIYKFSEVVANHNMEVTWKKIVVVVMHKVEILPTTGGSVSSSLTQVADGLGVDFTFTSEAGFKPDSIVINGKSYPLTGNTYHQSNVTTDLQVKVTWKRTMQGILMQHTWGDALLYKRDFGTTEWIPAQTHAYIYTFDEKNCKKFLDGVLIGESPYMFKGDSLIWGTTPLGNDGTRTKINTLNDETWDWTILSKYYQGPGDPALPDTEYREVYKAIK